MSAFAGVDLGATTLSVLVADTEGTVLGRIDGETPSRADGSNLRTALLDAIATACERAGVDRESVTAVGIASVGPIDGTGIREPANLPDVDRFEIVDPVVERFGCAVRLVNDATAGAIAEAAARDDDHLAYLTLSTGIGVGVVAAGRPLLGHRGNAGEVGHLTLDPDADLACGCGAPGHWEAFCGGANLVDHARAIVADGVETGIDLDAAGPATLLDAVGSDPLATRLADRLATWNAIGVASILRAYDPATVVVGGGVALNHHETVVEPVRERLPDHYGQAVPPIASPVHGADAPLRGALELAESKPRDRNR